MIKNKGIYIYIIVVILAILIGIIAYYSLFKDKRKEIYAVSLNNHKFVLATVEVEFFSFDERAGIMLFRVENPEDFIQNHVLNNPYYFKTYQYYNPNIDRKKDVYIFLKGQYYFMLYQDIKGTFAFKPMYSGYIKQDVKLLFPFVDYYYFWEEYDETIYSWEIIDQLNSFADVVEFYKNIDESYYTIMEDERKIVIHFVIPKFYLNDASSQYKIILNCLDEGINIEVIKNNDI